MKHEKSKGSAKGSKSLTFESEKHFSFRFVGNHGWNEAVSLILGNL